MHVPKFEIPVFELLPKRQVELPYHGTVAAGATLIIASGRITYPFKIIRAKMTFSEEANNLIRHGWYVSTSDAVTTGGIPSGINIFGRESPTAFFAGKGTIKTINTNVEYPEGNLFILLYTVNGCAYAYYIDASITIQQI